MIAEFLNTTVGRAFLFGILALIIYVPYSLCSGVKKMAHGKNLPSSEFFKCFIPFVNVVEADKTYFGKAHFGTYGMICLIGIPIRFLAVFITTESAGLYYLTFGLMAVGIIAWYMLNVIESYIIISDARVIGQVQALLFSIIFPFGYFYIGNILWAEINRASAKLNTTWKDTDL